MKKNIFPLLFLAISVSSFAQSIDEAAIKQVLDAETKAFFAADYKACQNNWAKVPYASFLYSAGLFVGDELWKKLDDVWATHKPRKVNFTRSNWNIRINGGAAFVTFNQSQENLENKAVTESYEERYMEKINGEWKIVNVTVWSIPKK